PDRRPPEQPAPADVLEGERGGGPGRVDDTAVDLEPGAAEEDAEEIADPAVALVHLDEPHVRGRGTGDGRGEVNVEPLLQHLGEAVGERLEDGRHVER